MKSLIQAVAVALTLATPAITFAQANQPLTRAQVRAEYIELKEAGYDPGDYSDSESLQTAQKIVAEHAVPIDASGYGRGNSATSQSGSK